ncbi:MAG: anaerobic ribonucleoside-triphosphate reductase activating protein [Candidatus Pacebacteria bacterium]|nr:anaerobic ribonucleoside-triphosphate reductase activating protein [Candidatus Paceibacterota bacterium]
MNLAGIIHESIVDGQGIRTVLFISGCKHNCYNCQNKELQNKNYGIPFTSAIENKIINYIKNDILVDGITLSGGDPMYSAKELIPFLQKFKTAFPNKTVWLYTGFLFESIQDNPIMNYIDVVVDGKYDEKLNDYQQIFKGSSNQRIIDTQKSLQNNQIVLYKLD